MTTIAIMQPYFVPYAGYFRLFSAADIFVVYDGVQFPKEGWVNRNKLPDCNDELSWLTLPLKKSPLDTTIREKEFADDAQPRWDKLLQRFPVLCDEANLNHPLRQHIATLNGQPVDFIVDTLRIANEALGISCEIIFSSKLDYDRTQDKQQRVIDIVKLLGGKHYINASGGTDLYDETAFTEQDLTLSFLPDYTGDTTSILYRLLTEDADAIRTEIEENT